jgi:hypothetical protein
MQAVIADWWHFWPGSISGDALGFGNWELLVGTAALLLSAGAVGAAVLTEPTNPFARPVAIGLLVGAPLTAFVFERTFAFAVPARYGSSVIGVAFLLVALTTARVPSRWLLLLSGCLWVTAFFSQWP